MKKTLSVLALALLLPLGLSATEAKKASCCAKGEKAAEGKDAKCEHEKADAAKKDSKSSCVAESKTEVVLTGKLLCEHCNLHRAEKCAAVFQAEGREGEIPVCPDTKDIEKLKGIGDHGKATVEVKGTLCKTKDGKQMLMIASLTKKA
jgi:hypothetical protein